MKLFCISKKLALKWAELDVPFQLVRSFGNSMVVRL